MQHFMKFKAIASAALISVLGLAASASAAVSANAGWTVTRINSAGEYYTVMTSTSTTFCFLTTVSVEDTDAVGESASCKITAQNGVWVMETILGKNGDAHVTCGVMCYNNG